MRKILQDLWENPCSRVLDSSKGFFVTTRIFFQCSKIFRSIFLQSTSWWLLPKNNFGILRKIHQSLDIKFGRYFNKKIFITCDLLYLVREEYLKHTRSALFWFFISEISTKFITFTHPHDTRGVSSKFFYRTQKDCRQT